MFIHAGYHAVGMGQTWATFGAGCVVGSRLGSKKGEWTGRVSEVRRTLNLPPGPRTREV